MLPSTYTFTFKPTSGTTNRDFPSCFDVQSTFSIYFGSGVPRQHPTVIGGLAGTCKTLRSDGPTIQKPIRRIQTRSDCSNNFQGNPYKKTRFAIEIKLDSTKRLHS